MLMIVLGLLCLLIGLVMAASGLAHIATQQARFFRAGSYYIFASIILFTAQFAIFKLPEIREARNSETARRRRENALNFRRPKPGRAAPDDRDDPRQGHVLIFVLVMLAIVSVLALQSLTRARSDHQRMDARTQNELLRLAAMDGMREAMQRLADDPDLDVDHPGEDWARRIEATDPSGITRTVVTRDLQRVFDLNNLSTPASGVPFAPADALGNIMAMCGMMRSGLQIQALQDAMDEDATGAFENTRYEREDQPNRVPDRILYGLNELLTVEGWSPDMFNRSNLKSPGNPFTYNLADCVGIIPVTRQRIIPVNIYTAEPPALKALFGPANEGVVERLLVVRNGPVRRSLDFLAGILGDDVLVSILPYLTVASSWFEISSSARNADGRAVHLHALAHRDEKGRVDMIKAAF